MYVVGLLQPWQHGDWHIILISLISGALSPKPQNDLDINR
jgi:hypothetical protein